MPNMEKVYYKDGSVHECFGVDAAERTRAHPNDWRTEPFSKAEIEEGKKQIAKEATAKEKTDKPGKAADVSAPVIDQAAIDAAVDAAVTAALAKRDADDKAATDKKAADDAAAKLAEDDAKAKAAAAGNKS